MKGKWFLVPLIAFVLLIVGCTFWGFQSSQEIISISNSGKIVFETEQEYGDFKRAIAQPEIRIMNIDVLSSDPPIVVIFQVVHDAGISFPYGLRTTHYGDFAAPIETIGVTFGLIFAILTFGLYFLRT